MGVQSSIGVALVVGAVVNHDIVAIAVVPAGHGDNAACHSADVGAAGRGKINALVAAAAILAGDILIARQRADKVQRAADGRIGVVPLGLGNQRFQVSVIFISSLIELCLFIALGFFQSLLLRCGGGDAGILGLNVAGQLLGFAVQLAFLVLQLFFVRFQRCLRFFQLGALVGQLNALLFQILAGLGVGIRNILQHLVKGQQLINVFRRGKQRNTAALVQHLHTDDLLFIFCPAVIVFCLLLVNFSLLIGDLLFFFHDLCADIINLVIQRIDLALDGVFLLHKQLFLLLGFGFIAGNVFQLLADLVQFRLQLVLFVFQLFLLIIGMGRHGSIQAQRRGNHGSHQRSPCAPHIAADGNGHFQRSPFDGMRVKRVLAVQKAQGKRRVLRPADVCGCWLQCQCRTAQSQTA